MYRRPTNFGNIIVMRSETLAQSQETLHSGAINQMHNFINNAEKAFDGTKATNLNNFSREFTK